MQMIGHEQDQVRPEDVVSLAMSDCFEKTVSYLGNGELILMTLPAIDRDEVYFAIRIHPCRHVMWQLFSEGNIHAKSILPANWSVNSENCVADRNGNGAAHRSPPYARLGIGGTGTITGIGDKTVTCLGDARKGWFQ
jgi:hypothetical protein